jgi:hypothetical protein
MGYIPSWKLIVVAVVEKLPAFIGTRTAIIMFTTHTEPYVSNPLPHTGCLYDYIKKK